MFDEENSDHEKPTEGETRILKLMGARNSTNEDVQLSSSVQVHQTLYGRKQNTNGGIHLFLDHQKRMVTTLPIEAAIHHNLKSNSGCYNMQAVSDTQEIHSNVCCCIRI